MPACVKCNTHNNIERKTCKKCGQALIIEEGEKCKFCFAVNGPFAKKCRKCGENLDNIENSIDQKVNNAGENQLNEFFELIKSSYLYDNINNTFAKEEFTVSLSEGKIYFTLGDSSYIFEKADELEYIFDLGVNSVPDFIREKAVRLIRPVFEKYDKNSNLRMLDDTLGYEDYVLAYANEKGQLAATRYLPIYEQKIETLTPEIIEVCNKSDSYLSMYTNDMFIALIDTMNAYHYSYQLIKGNDEEFVYTLGEKTITVHIFEDGESLKISYLNKQLLLTKNDIEFISYIFLNWMFNIIVEPMTIGERMKIFFNDSPSVLGKLMSYFNKSLYTTHYNLTENEDLVLNIVSENVVKFTFKELKASVTEPVHTNMPYPEFDKMLECYIDFANNKNFIQYIKAIEDSTENTVIISDVSSCSCKIGVYTPNVSLSSII